ncbi:MAG: VWA domain-containing protein [Acidimicrobiia bacterium]
MSGLHYDAASAFWLLVVLAALVAVYVVVQLRRPKYAVRFTNLALLDVVAPKRPQWRRHLPAAAMVLGLFSLVVAMAKPSRDERVPVERATVVLALDVSLSMEATDVAPSRLDAAKQAALEFVRTAPPQVRLGLVTFARNAQVKVAPTLDRKQMEVAIQSMSLGQGTAIGEAIFASLDAVEADLAIDAPVTPTAPTTPGATTPGATSTAPASTTVDPNKPKAAAIVVMSDGTTTQGRANAEGVAAANSAGIPVSTIAYGTAGGVIDTNQGPVAVPVDGDALRKIADDTGGSFFEASSGQQLSRILENIGARIGTEPKRHDVSGWFTAMAFVWLLVAAVGSLLWFSRLP